ncbi:hypothetical protein F4860DRAFT_515694 [Xylaria cubensis]|nr:hypothetical protein F4860DRAFT_515694 [Xylaria cubensis]
MRSSTEHQENFNNDPEPRVFEFLPRKRRGSLPSPRSEIWAEQQKPYVPGEKPTRSVSLRVRSRSHHHDKSQLLLKFWPEPITQGFITPITRGEGHDTCNEDKWNGVLIRYSQGQCHPMQNLTKNDVKAEFQRLERRRKELSATLDKWKGPYEEGRRLYFETRGLGWTEPQWTQFLSTENSYFDVRDKLFAVEDMIKHNAAQMYLFKEPVGLSLNSGVWLREEDTAIWSLEGVAEQKARSGERPVLEWRGIDYNATERTCEPPAPSCEHCENILSLA